MRRLTIYFIILVKIDEAVSFGRRTRNKSRKQEKRNPVYYYTAFSRPLMLSLPISNLEQWAFFSTVNSLKFYDGWWRVRPIDPEELNLQCSQPSTWKQSRSYKCASTSIHHVILALLIWSLSVVQLLLDRLDVKLTNKTRKFCTEKLSNRNAKLVNSLTHFLSFSCWRLSSLWRCWTVYKFTFNIILPFCSLMLWEAFFIVSIPLINFLKQHARYA